MLKNYFIIAWRNLIRHKLNTTINILGLSMGITTCLVIFLLVRFEFSYDNFHPDKNRIYRLVALLKNPQGNNIEAGCVTVPLPMTLRKELSGFESVSAFYNLYANVKIPDASGKITKEFEKAREREEASEIIVAEPQYFEIFKYKWLAGNPATSLKDPFKVVLSEKQAVRYFGNKNPADWIGRQIIYSDSLKVTVSGIVQDWKQNSDFGFKDFISYSTADNSFLKNDIDMSGWGMWDFDAQGIVKLSRDVTPAQVEKQFPAFLKSHIQAPPGFSEILYLQPVSDIHFNEHYKDSYSRKASRPVLYSLIGIAVFILLIAAINFINLSTAQSVKRAREIGVRKVLGSGRSGLILQFMTETWSVVFFSILLAIIFTNPVISVFHSMIPSGVKLYLDDFYTILFLGIIMLVTCLLAGLYPAKVISSFQPALSLKGRGSAHLNSKSYLRKSLILFQFTVSLFFIIGTLIINKQIHFILNKDLGFDKEAIITTSTPRDRSWDNREILKEKFKQIPGIQMVTRHMETPTAKGHSGTFIEIKGVKDIKVDASFDLCDESYVPLFGMKMIAGRNIFHSDTLHEFLINETCAKALGFKQTADALGQIVHCGINDGQGPVVGIVKDFHSASLHEVITPFFISSNKNSESQISVKLSENYKTTGQLSVVLAQMEKAWKTLYPDKKFEFRFFDETIASLYDREQKTSQLMNTAMAVAIFISCMGLLGMATFTAELRTREIGIRKVFGASVSNIVSMLSSDFLKPVLAAIVIASPLAYYFMHQWLQDFAYRVNISWWIYIFAGISALLIALITVSFQAFRAATANPVKCLRTE